mgnify:FL=1
MDGTEVSRLLCLPDELLGAVCKALPSSSDKNVFARLCKATYHSAAILEQVKGLSVTFTSVRDIVRFPQDTAPETIELRIADEYHLKEIVDRMVSNAAVRKKTRNTTRRLSIFATTQRACEFLHSSEGVTAALAALFPRVESLHLRNLCNTGACSPSLKMLAIMPIRELVLQLTRGSFAFDILPYQLKSFCDLEDLTLDLSEMRWQHYFSRMVCVDLLGILRSMPRLRCIHVRENFAGDQARTRAFEEEATERHVCVKWSACVMKLD